MTVFAYRHDETDRLAELENFKRERTERLDSVFLRLSSILDSSANLVSPNLRSARSEYFLCQAMFLLCLPGVRPRLMKFKMDRTTNGQYVTSHDLLKIAMKFEETIFPGRSQEIYLGIKDPFLSMGEVSTSSKRQKEQKPSRADLLPAHLQNAPDDINAEPMPYMFDRSKQNNTDLPKDNINKSIYDLDKKIDELAKIYAKRVTIKEESKDEIDVHGITDETPVSNPDTSSSHVWSQMIKPFLEAQYNFLSSYDYKNDGRHPPFYQIERWGSRYNAPMQRRSWDLGRADQQYPENRPPLQRPRMFNGSNPPNGGTGFFRNSQPRKRLRFSEWIRMNDSVQNSSSSDIPSRGNSPNQPYDNYNYKSKDCMVANKNNGIKRNQLGDSKNLDIPDTHIPRTQNSPSSINNNVFKGNLKLTQPPNQIK